MKVNIIHKNGYKTVDLNRKKGVRERCLNCSGWNAVEVELCKQTECALHEYRMNRNNQNAKKGTGIYANTVLFAVMGVLAKSKNVLRTIVHFMHSDKLRSTIQ